MLRPFFRRTLALVASLVTLTAGSRGLAEEIPVPVPLQAELAAKVVAYDANLPARAQGKVRIRILVYADNAESRSVAAEFQGALAAMPTIAGLPHEESTMIYTDANALARACKADHVSIVYITPGMSDDQLSAMVLALTGVSVMTVAAMPRLVPLGVVLGFDLSSSKPKLLVHLTQARKQQVALSSNVLRLMKIFE
jgi:hypothetical protein